VERCPNCGASVREGARFCTACGFRMSETNQVGSRDTTAQTSTSPWWSEGNEEQQSREPVTVTESGASDETGTSFWDRVEDATRAREERDPFQSWESGLRNLASSETTEEEHQSDRLAPGISDESSSAVFSSSLRSSEEHVDELTSADDAGNDNGEMLVASENQAAPEPTVAGNDISAAAGAGSGIVAGIHALAESLASARVTHDDEFNERLDKLRSAIEVARERPREIDAMLALSGQVDTIIELVATNERMAAAIDSAVNALRGEQRG
jgi:hypothetical protein